MTRASTAATAKSARRTPVSRGRANRHELVVLARDAADAVRSAGGLLYDRASSGWVVEVYLEQATDANSFEVLGVPHAPLNVGLHRMGAWPDSFIVSAELRGSNTDVRQLFATASRRLFTEVALWGGDWPRDAAPEVGRVEHRLSVAARAFKAHAMAGVGLASAGVTVETFRSGRRPYDAAAQLTPTA